MSGMKNIHYAGEQAMTGDAIADAVLDYAETLAKHESSATIDVPVVSPNGTVANARFLIGPASQLVATPIESEFPDPMDEELIELIRLKRKQLDGVEVSATESDVKGDFDFDIRLE